MQDKEIRWTKSALLTLQHVHENETRQIKQAVNALNGSMRNWAYLLLREEYVTNKEALTLTDKGKDLLKKLTENPPPGKTRRPTMSQQNMANPESESNYRVRIEGSEALFEVLLDKQSAMEIIRLASELKKK
jgi:hypothetical protein